MSEEDLSGNEDRQISRRTAIKRVGAGGLGMLGAGLLGGAIGAGTVGEAKAESGSTSVGDSASHDPGTVDYGTGRLSGHSPTGAAAGPYGGDFAPPEAIEPGHLDALTYPPPARSGTQELEMTVVELDHAVSRVHTAAAWTYNGTAPGPVIRATEGDLLRIRFTNQTGHDHNLHFHGRHSPVHDGWEPVPPGGATTYEIEAGPAGVHPYHCHTMPIDQHIAKGLYGTLIVDPVGGRPDAHEVVLGLSGWDLDGDGRNEVYSWNGLAGYYAKFPIKVTVGDPVRLYLLNMTEFDPVASFHLHATTFDVYPAGMGNQPAFSHDVISLGQMDRAILEFSFPELGRYMFHPHQHSMAARGAMGWFAAI